MATRYGHALLLTGMRFDSSLVTIYVEGRSYNLKIGMYYSVVLTLISPRGKRRNR